MHKLEYTNLMWKNTPRQHKQYRDRLSTSLHSQNRQKKQTWHYKVGWVTYKEHANAVADGVTRNFFTQQGQRHIIISQRAGLVTCSQTRHRCGASLPYPQGPVGGRKGDQGRLGCLPSVPKYGSLGANRLRDLISLLSSKRHQWVLMSFWWGNHDIILCK